jgi:hypothetical protein
MVMSIIIPVWAGANVFGWKKYEIVICVIIAILAVLGTGCVLISYADEYNSNRS